MPLALDHGCCSHDDRTDLPTKRVCLQLTGALQPEQEDSLLPEWLDVELLGGRAAAPSPFTEERWAELEQGMAAQAAAAVVVGVAGPGVGQVQVQVEQEEAAAAAAEAAGAAEEVALPAGAGVVEVEGAGEDGTVVLRRGPRTMKKRKWFGKCYNLLLSLGSGLCCIHGRIILQSYTCCAIGTNSSMHLVMELVSSCTMSHQLCTLAIC